MTPIARWLARFLPPSLATIGLVLIYGFMLIAVLAVSSNGTEQIVYIDVRGS